MTFVLFGKGFLDTDILLNSLQSLIAWRLCDESWSDGNITEFIWNKGFKDSKFGAWFWLEHPKSKRFCLFN